jgi:hypothetical protein
MVLLLFVSWCVLSVSRSSNHIPVEAILTHRDLVLGASEAVYQIESSFPMTMYPRAHVSH